MFIISLGNWIELQSTPQSQAVHTSEYGPLNQPITAHLVPKSYNKRLKTLDEKEAVFLKHLTIKNCNRTFRKGIVKNF